MTNQQIMERAAITTAQLAQYGKLNPEQARQFIDYVFDLSVLKSIGRQEKFDAEQKYIEKIGVGNRVAVRKSEAVDSMIRRLVSTSRVVLNPQDVIVPFEISDRFTRHNVEGDGGPDHVIKMMATQVANNADELWIGGITTVLSRLENEIFDGGSTSLYIGDDYLSMFNGFLVQSASGNVVDAANSAVDSSNFNKAILAMPVKYRRNRNLLKFLLSPDHEQAWREYAGQRMTPAGDTALQSEANLTPYGVELIPIPMLERNPLTAEDIVAVHDTAVALSYKPITDFVATVPNLGITPGSGQAAWVLATDYTVDLTNGTITVLSTGNIANGATVRCTYRTGGKLLLTNPDNLILAMGMDVMIEKARNIYKGVNEYAITVSIDCKFENVDAVVLLKNLADPTA
jgi:hypothetical protein